MNVFKNFLYNAGYQLLIIVVPFILSPYVSRVIGPEGVGTYSYTYSITALTALFANLGVLKYGNREIAGCRDNREKCSRIFAELMSMKIACGIVVVTCFLLYIRFFAGKYRTAFFMQIPVILSYVADVSWVFWGMQEFRKTALVSSAVKLLSVVFVFVFVRTGNDTEIYILILASSMLLVQLILWAFLPRYIDIRLSLRFLANRHWKSMVLLFFPVLARYLYITMDKIMIGRMVGITEVGYYENVQSITTTLVHVLTALGDVIMPQMTLYFGQKKKEEAERLFAAAFHLSTFLAVGMMFGLIGVADSFVPWFYGDKFTASVPLLMTVAPLVLLTGYSDLIRNVFLLPQYKDREYMIALAAGAGANFLINFALIPRMKSTGAVIGTLAAEFLVLAIQTVFVQREFRVIRYLRKTVVYCILGALILIPCRGIREITENLTARVILDVAAGGLLYSGCVFLYLRQFEKTVFATISSQMLRMIPCRKGRDGRKDDR